MYINFPNFFLWGASISSYQTEGENFNTDWYFWEREKNLFLAGKASNHYYLFKEDFQLASKLNLNSLRISFEWARLCPNPDEFNTEALKHYIEVIDTLCGLGIKPIVCLHHFTNPYWFFKNGGWLVSKNIDFFLEYLRHIVYSFRDKVQYWLIFNEPVVYVYNSFIKGIWPPGMRSFKDAKKVLSNIITAYKIGYEELKRINVNTDCKVSFAKNVRIFKSCKHFSFGLNILNTFIRDKVFNFSIFENLISKNYLDFIAINYYTKEYVHYKGLYGKECLYNFSQERKNVLGWYVYPQGLYEILLRLKKFNLPIMISENGTAEIEDSCYEDYLIAHLKSVAKLISLGVNVIGYFWWSLIDNFEWDKGFSPRFGLIEVDYNTFERKIRNFAFKYANICKENRVQI